MQRTLIVCTAAMITALTLSACSGGNGSTTAPPGTTAPGTTTAQTTAPATLPATTAIQTMPPATVPATQPSTTAGSSGSAVGEAFRRSYQSLDALDSYRVTTTSQSTVFGNEIMSTTVMDVFPKDKLYKITSEAAGVTSVSYMTQDRMYVQMPDGSWGMMKLDEQLPPSEAIGQIPDVEFSDMFEQQATADGYIIRTRRPLTMEEMMKLGTTPGSPGSSAQPEGVEELGDDFAMSYEMETRMDKNYRTLSTDMQMIMEVEGMAMETDAQMVYSDFDALDPLEIPQEALNAREITTTEP